MRIGIIALQHESNTFLRQPTTLDDFRRGILVSGKDLLDRYADAHHEVGGFLEGVAAAGFEAVPIFAAWATPSGIIAAETYETLLGQMMRDLSDAGRLDAVLVAPHGAGVSERESDMDGCWLTQVRDHLGSKVPVVCTLDPHANLSQRMVDMCDAIIAYRTNPHLDQRARGIEAATLLARMLRGEVRPTMAAAMPPIAINIAKQQNDQPPSLHLIEHADAQLHDRRLLSNSVLYGFPYADVAEMGSSFIVVTDNDQALARSLADQLAAWLMQRRSDFAGDLPDLEQAIDRALGLSGAVCLLDVGDNVGGGSPADGTLIAEALHRRGIGSAFVCIADPQAVQQCQQAGEGALKSLSIGGKSDDLHGPPLNLPVQIRRLCDGAFTEPQPRHGGKTSYDMGRCAVVETDTRITLLLTTHRTPPFSLGMIRCCGLDPHSFRILVAKGVNAPIAAYREVCEHFIRVNTPGVTTADMTTLPLRHRRRPMFPFESINSTLP
jgi:microcystin degradation protein MlrC